MNITTWLNKRAQQLAWYDISLTKMSTFLFALFIAQTWPPILYPDAKIYLTLALVLAVRPAYQFYFQNKSSN